MKVTVSAELAGRELSLTTGEIAKQAAGAVVVRYGDTVVFVEVRQRRSARFGGAAASITPAKQARLTLAAEHYLQTLSSVPPCRFDAVLFDGAQPPHWVQNII